MATTTANGRKQLGVFGGYFAKQCEEYVRKEYSPLYDHDLKVAVPEVLQARFEAGNVFEAELIETLRGLHGHDSGVVFLDSPEDRSDRKAVKAWERESMKAFRDPTVWLIINPRLAPVPAKNLTGEPDFAVRAADGGWYPLDAKDHSEMEGSAKPVARKVSTLAKPALADATDEDMVGKPQLKDSLQLAHYHQMFQAHEIAVQEDTPVWGGIIGRTGKVVWRRLDVPMYRNAREGEQLSAIDYVTVERDHRLQIVQREREREDLGLKPLSQPEWHSECPNCPWRQVCFDELVDADDISLLPGITPARASVYRSKGVHTVGALAKLDHRTAVLNEAKVDTKALRAAAYAASGDALTDPAESLLSNRGKTLERITDLLHKEGFQTVANLRELDRRTSAIPYVNGMPRAIDQARVTRVSKVHLARDTEFVKFERASIEVDVDFEDSGGYTYMFGMLISGRKVRPNGDRKTRSEYRAFCSWDKTEDGEARAFAAFWAEIQRIISYACQNKWGARFYHYTQHEDHAIKALAERHAGKPGVPSLEDVTEFLDSKKWVDLYPVVTRDMVWPTRDYTVKSIAKYVRHSWSGDGANGALSLVWYDEAVNHPDEKVREQRREELLVYNRQDNEATLKIRDWITELSDTQRRPGEKLPHVSTLDKRFRLRP